MPFVGRKLRLKILEVNRKANRLILSEKVALYEERREKRDELFSSLQVGQKVSGTVRSIAPFGVFIDLGGIDGLVHKSELSWNKVNNPESGYKVGDEVEAEVIDINHERGRISLSIRRLQPDPWHSTVADFKVGDVIDGTVTKLVNFGAFVRVRDGLEGLIHISELSHQRVAHPGDVVHEGQTLKLKIISLDSERHRLGLSLKQAEEAPARPAPGARQRSAGVRAACRAWRASAATGARLVDVRCGPGARGRDRQHAGRRVRPGPRPARGLRRGTAASREASDAAAVEAGGRADAEVAAPRRPPPSRETAEPEAVSRAGGRRRAGSGRRAARPSRDRRGRGRAAEPEADRGARGRRAEPEVADGRARGRPPSPRPPSPRPSRRGRGRGRAASRRAEPEAPPSPRRSPSRSPSRSRGRRAERRDDRGGRRADRRGRPPTPSPTDRGRAKAA